MTTQHFMLDVETLGQDTRVAPVISLACVAFRPGQGIQHSVDWVFNSDDQIHRKADFATIQWWMKQRPEVAAHWVEAELYHSTASRLDMLRAWVHTFSPTAETIWWGNSPNFDETIMTGLYKEFSITPPWKFREWRDVRTIREFLKDKTFPKNPSLHNPLSDCKVQIELVERFYKEQGLI